MDLRKYAMGIGIAAFVVAGQGCAVGHMIVHGGGSAHVLGVGPETTEDRTAKLGSALADVTEVQADSGGIHLAVEAGGAASVSVTVDENLQSHLVTRISGRLLTVGFDADVNPTRIAEVKVKLPTVAGLSLTGATHGDLTGLNSPHFSTHVSGASKLVVTGTAKDIEAEASGAAHILFKEVDSDSMKVTLTGASNFAAFGSTGILKLQAGGGSNVALGALKSAAITLEASGASDVEVYASKSIDATASGASHVRYLGNATIGRKEATGGASIQPEPVG